MRITVLWIVVLLSVNLAASAEPGQPVAVRYWGQAMVSIETAGKLRIVIDPYGLNIGYADPKVSGDLVLITHEHGDHNNAALVGGNPRVERGLGDDKKIRNADFYLDRLPNEQKPAVFAATDTRKPSGNAVRCRTISAEHDDADGARRGANAMWLIEADGVRILHCGDLGEPKLTDATLQAIGTVDVLLIPVGGVYTIDGAQAAAIVLQLKPRMVVPIHYRTDKLKINLRPVDDFLAALPAGIERPKTTGNTLTVTQARDDKREQPRVVVLGYQP